MNTIGQTTLMGRIKNAIRAFQGKPIQSISLGVDVKRCDECEYKGSAGMREHLMVIMGARAAYMHSAGTIDIPEGLEAEGELVDFVKKIVERYIREATDGKDVNFDEYIETALIEEYAIVLKPEKMYEFYKRSWCKDRGYDLEAMDEEVGINGECYACFDEWYSNEFARTKGE
jgi:hypothetical protein